MVGTVEQYIIISVIRYRPPHLAARQRGIQIEEPAVRERLPSGIAAPAPGIHRYAATEDHHALCVRHSCVCTSVTRTRGGDRWNRWSRVKSTIWGSGRRGRRLGLCRGKYVVPLILVSLKVSLKEPRIMKRVGLVAAAVNEHSARRAGII